MAAPYIPTKDSALDAWATNFSTKITADPPTYGLTPADAVAIADLVNAYHAAYLLGGKTGGNPNVPVNPATWTPVTVAAKDSAKGAMLPIAREYAILIRNNAGVTDEERTDLGLTIPKLIKTPVPAPVSYPLLSLVASLSGTVQFGMRDSLTPTIKAKPFGATAMEVFVHMSAEEPDAPVLPDYQGIRTKSPFSLPFSGADAGKLAWLWGRWITRTGLVGPFSAALPFAVPTGGGT